MRYTFYILVLLLFSCGNAKEISKKKSKINVDQHVLVTGKYIPEEFIEQNDSIKFYVEFAFFDPIIFPYQDSINKIIKEEYVDFMFEDSLNDFPLSDLFYCEGYEKQRTLNEFKTLTYHIKVDETYEEFVKLHINASYQLFKNQFYAEDKYYLVNRNNGHKMSILNLVNDIENFSFLMDSCFREQYQFKSVNLFEHDFYTQNNTLPLPEYFYFKDDAFIVHYNAGEIADSKYGNFIVSVPLTLSNRFFKVNLSKKIK